ncbi:helicase-related protein [Coralliovum pocilloporae]|uniref:helicase-related protein n=1 Tax=Coralliovum pocilloporae TaxID=3066369 RepID=UPI003307539C
MTSPPHITINQTAPVKAVLGPTNTGKTHFAIERMLANRTGMIGLPLRLLAREVYARVTDRVGLAAVALITGEERIIPKSPRYWISTVEAMPKDIITDFVAIDEIQLAGDFERGHIFTDRMLTVRGQYETLLLGSDTMRPLIQHLLPNAEIITRPRMSVLSYAASKKISRLPRRSAIVAFSANDVYAIAELVRRQRGGAAVVMGSLSPRTRNAQVELFQSGDVDFLVATDAIGMGLNLDVHHVAFASDYKFDGFQYRPLSAAELGQIAGRAGRHTRDGSFGVTGRTAPFDDGLVERLETHEFEPLKVLQWRNNRLDFSSIDALRLSLETPPDRTGLTKAPPADDIRALEYALRLPEIAEKATERDRISLLWDLCQIPDYRKIAPASHAELLATLFEFLENGRRIPSGWFASQTAYADRLDGDIDTLANRIAHIRTWTFVSNRKDWLDDPAYWREETRAIEDRLSDALHEKLTQRFVDRRTSVLMKRLRENVMLEAEITAGGEIVVEGQHVGHITGFRFTPDATADGPEAKALRAAANKVLSAEVERRAVRLADAANQSFILSSDGSLRWQGEVIAKLSSGDDALSPRFVLLADEHLSGPSQEKVQQRIDLWLANHVETLLKPLIDLKNAEGLEGIARGIAFQLVEGLGILERSKVAEEIRQLDQDARGSLRKYGVRFGAYHIYIPALLKPAPANLLTIFWALSQDCLDAKGVVEVPQLSIAGRTSVEADPEISQQIYLTSGFKVYGQRAVRIDILERLADLIRPILAWRPGTDSEMPEGALETGRGFTVTVAMTSLLGCAGEDFSSILKSLGYRVERRLIEPSEEAAETSAETISDTAAAEEAPKQEDSAQAATHEDAPAAEAVEDEPKYLEIWRPQRQDRQPRHSNKQRADNNRNRKGAAKQGKPSQQSSNKKQGGSRSDKGRADKPLDPNSPFAALAALKDTMSKHG